MRQSVRVVRWIAFVGVLSGLVWQTTRCEAQSTANCPVWLLIEDPTIPPRNHIYLTDFYPNTSGMMCINPEVGIEIGVYDDLPHNCYDANQCIRTTVGGNEKSSKQDDKVSVKNLTLPVSHDYSLSYSQKAPEGKYTEELDRAFIRFAIDEKGQYKDALLIRFSIDVGKRKDSQGMSKKRLMAVAFETKLPTGASPSVKFPFEDVKALGGGNYRIKGQLDSILALTKP